MATTVAMPQLGETVTEGTILRWAKAVGDTIAEDEILLEISTDKVDTEVPSPVAGTILEILVAEGETVAVGTELCVIGEAGEQPGAPAAEPEAAAEPEPAPEPEAAAEPEPAPEPEAAAEPEPAPEPEAAAEPELAPEPEAAAEPELAPEPDGAPRLLSPVVRRLVREHDVDLSKVAGTGEGGRITRRDVEAHLESRGAEPAPIEPAPTPAEPEAPVAPAPPAPAAPPPAPAAPAAPAAPPAPAEVPAGDDDEVVDLSRLRVRIGENMLRAKQTAAHVWTSVEVDYERVERVRRRHREAFKAEEGFSLTYLPFIARATIDALREYPIVNSSYYLEEKKAVFHRAVNLGIAIDLDQQGLVVATIREADGLRLVGLAREIRAMADKARAGKLEPDDVMGSTFTITNPGPYGSFLSAPIINVPNTGILSTETVVKRPAVVTGADGEDVIAIRHIGYLGLTWDHRAFDGSASVLFLRRIKENLESWDWEQELA
jgi:pyruvate dehydrogenase E2 component (dihydrolipoamide acetyltransferase)